MRCMTSVPIVFPAAGNLPRRTKTRQEQFVEIQHPQVWCCLQYEGDNLIMLLREKKSFSVCVPDLPLCKVMDELVKERSFLLQQECFFC